MAVFRCKMCGGDLDVINTSSNIITCEYCKTQQTIPTLDSEKKANLFSRANRLRMNNEFDKAAGIYETIASEFIEEPEAYWGLCLCKYGIEYVDDPLTAKKIPTCHRTSYQSIFEDENFTTALEYADAEATNVYRREAKEIDRIQKEIINIANKEEPFDIFICYKETDENGERTKDSVLAQDLYEVLTEKGYKVFFSKITLEDKLGKAYEPYIFAALSSAKVMLAVGTKYEYFNAVWVKNEWARFLEMMKNDKNKSLIPCYADIDAYDMPTEFRNFQGQDMTKIGFKQDLIRGIGKLIGTGISTQQITYSAAPTLEKCINNAEIYLNMKNYSAAFETYQTMVHEYPGNYFGWWGLVLASTNNLSIITDDDDKIKDWYGYAISLSNNEQKMDIESRMREYLRAKSAAFADGSRDMYSRKIAKAEGTILTLEAEITDERERQQKIISEINTHINHCLGGNKESSQMIKKLNTLKKRRTVSTVSKFFLSFFIIASIVTMALGLLIVDEPFNSRVLVPVFCLCIFAAIVSAFVHAISSTMLNFFRKKNYTISPYTVSKCNSEIKKQYDNIEKNETNIANMRKQLETITSTENKKIVSNRNAIEKLKSAIADINQIKDDKENISLQNFYSLCTDYKCDTPTPNAAFIPFWDKAVEAVNYIENL